MDEYEKWAAENAYKMNEFAWNLFAKVAVHEKYRPPDTGISAATMLVQLAAIGLGTEDENGINECERNLGGLQLDMTARGLEKIGEKRSCIKWFPMALIVAPSGRPLNAEFVEQSKRRFNAEVRSENLRLENGKNAVALINRLVKEKSEDHMTEMLSPDHHLSSAQHPNTIVTATSTYFHPWWNVKFDRNKTTDSPFYETPERERRVMMMYREEVLPCHEGNVSPDVRVQMVGLASRKNSGMVYFVVPVEKFGLHRVIGTASMRSLMSLMKECVPRSVQFWLPKFRLSDTVEIVNDLKSLGLNAWTNADKLNSIMDDRGRALRIGEMFQQTVIRFNEDGDEKSGEDEEFESDDVMKVPHY